MSFKTLKIFDFDGTIYRSPTPNPWIWNPTVRSALDVPPSKGGYGWWQNPITLSAEVTPDDLFVDEVVEEVRKASADPECMVVLLTGRTANFKPEVLRILAKKNLSFDAYGLRTEGHSSTFAFKESFVKGILAENPTITRVEVWEDREKQAKKFEGMLSSMQVEHQVHRVASQDWHMPVSDERRIVEHLMSVSGKTMTEGAGESRPRYFGVVLDKESIDYLKNRTAGVVPSGWNVKADHMTMLFGKTRNQEVEDYLHANLFKRVSLLVTHIGVSEHCVAVKVAASVPVANPIPHVTVAVKPGSKPVMSNEIAEWTPIQSPFPIDGTVLAVY